MMNASHRYVAAPTKLAVTATTGRTSAGLAAAQWRMTAIGGTVYFRRGGATVEATTSHTPLADGTSILLTIESDASSYIAAITASGTATLFFDRLE